MECVPSKRFLFPTRSRQSVVQSTRPVQRSLGPTTQGKDHMQKGNGNGSQISVLVAESCLMNCELMSTALERYKQRLTVVASATDSNEIQTAYEQHRPEVCIISAQLKDGPNAGF